MRLQQRQNNVVWVCSSLLTLLHHSVCAVGIAGVEVVVEVASLVTNNAAVAVAAAPVAVAGELVEDAPQVRNRCQKNLTKVTDQTFLLSTSFSL